MQISKLFWLSLLLLMTAFCVNGTNNVSAVNADVGVILDLDTSAGKICRTAISMAIQDFYSNHNNYTTMIVPHFRNSKTDIVDAASAAIDLLKNTQVMAIIGPQRSAEAAFVIDIGDKVRVPVISPATSPALSPKDSPYFIRSAWSSSSQAKAIAAIVEAFGWREVVFVYEDSVYGSGLLPFLSKALLQSNVKVSNRSEVSPASENDQILENLQILKAMQTRVLVVDMPSALASRFFQMAKKVGMMRKGYAWIITYPLASFLDSETIEAMQGVLGVKAYIPGSDELTNFTRRWSKRLHEENPDMDRTEVNAFGLWAYDSIIPLAEAIESVGLTSPRFKKPVNRANLTDLEGIGSSNTGPSLVHLIRNYKSKGLSGDVNITDGQLLPSAFEIVNVIGKGEITVGFWTEKYGISKELMADDHKSVYSTKRDNLLGILWPGQASEVPKGWEISKTLRVGVPATSGFREFLDVERVAEKSDFKIAGLCIDVFQAVWNLLPYAVPYEIIPFETPHGQSAGGYDDLMYQIFRGIFDVVVEDKTIVADGSRFVDFSVPYTESGFAAIVPIKGNESKTAWIFMKPLTIGLWLTIGAFFVFTGFVIWVLEHRVNKQFRGPPAEQVGIIFWFSFSTLVFAHREKVVSNLARFVVVVWLFVVLVLTSSYTANLTSMLTVRQLQPTDIYDLIKNGEYIGFRDSSSYEFLNTRILDSSKLRKYDSVEDYDEALSRGSKNGGVAAIFDDPLHTRVFLLKHCRKYTTIGPTYVTSGFRFAFPKGSPLLPDVSNAISTLKDDGEIEAISRKWLGEDSCNGTASTSESLNLDSFKGLFLIAGLSSSSALVIYLFTFLYEHRYILTSTASTKLKLYGLARVFNEQKYCMSKESTTVGPEGMLSLDADTTTTESGIPLHHASPTEVVNP